MTQHSAEILDFQPKPAHEYFDPTVNLETLPIPLVRFPGFKKTIPDKELVCKGWQEFIAEVAPELTGVAPQSDDLEQSFRALLHRRHADRSRVRS